MISSHISQYVKNHRLCAQRSQLLKNIEIKLSMREQICITGNSNGSIVECPNSLKHYGERNMVLSKQLKVTMTHVSKKSKKFQ
jgi:hypothetical protein